MTVVVGSKTHSTTLLKCRIDFLCSAVVGCDFSGSRGELDLQVAAYSLYFAAADLTGRQVCAA